MVRRWREDKGWSHDELAKKLKVSRPCIAQWETGRTSPAEKRLRDLARIFGVSVPDFFRGPDPAPPRAAASAAGTTQRRGLGEVAWNTREG